MLSFIFNRNKKEQKQPVVAETNTIKVISARYREELSKKLKAENLKFVECNTRMNYGMIGSIYRNGKLAIMLYGSTFYMHDKEIPVNLKLIELIRGIQREFDDVTRNEHGRICVSEVGFGAID